MPLGTLALSGCRYQSSCNTLCSPKAMRSRTDLSIYAVRAPSLVPGHLSVVHGPGRPVAGGMGSLRCPGSWSSSYAQVGSLPRPSVSWASGAVRASEGRLEEGGDSQRSPQGGWWLIFCVRSIERTALYTHRSRRVSMGGMGTLLVSRGGKKPEEALKGLGDPNSFWRMFFTILADLCTVRNRVCIRTYNCLINPGTGALWQAGGGDGRRLAWVLSEAWAVMAEGQLTQVGRLRHPECLMRGPPGTQLPRTQRDINSPFISYGLREAFW